MTRTRILLSAVVLCLGWAAPGMAEELPSCSLPGDEGKSLDCQCSADAPVGRVWGSGPYTGDSDICTAARHAGAVGANGGPLRVTRVAGQDSYDASSRNGVETTSWGRYANSFTVAALVTVEDCALPPEEGASLTCYCTPGALNRSVWGSGPYTGDSDICTAARHAGAIDGQGGEVTLDGLPGAERYEGTTANGVTTRAWGAYRSSFDFAGRPADGPVEARQTTDDLPVCAGLSEEAERLDCTCEPDSPARSAWGTGPYTGDSDLCTAARHAGVIGTEGGVIRALRVPGLDAYSGSDRNGVATKGWGDFGYSVVFDTN